MRFRYTFWAGPGEGPKWWRPDRSVASVGRTEEPVTIYAQSPPRLLRRLGAFNVFPEPSIQEMEVELLAGETIRPDAARLFRSRPSNWHNPLAEKDGMPGVAFYWMEVEGPLYDQWPPKGHRLLFDDLKVVESAGQLGTAQFGTWIAHRARFGSSAQGRSTTARKIHDQSLSSTG